MAADKTDLQSRVLSALIIAPVILLAVYAGGTAYNITVTIFALIALWEWLRLIDSKAEGDVVFLSYAALLLTVGMAAWQSAAVGAVFGIALTTALYFLALPDYKQRTRWIVLGLPYLASFALAALYLRATPRIGMDLVYYLLAVVWAADIGAFAAGRLIGGKKLAPSISPHKTWAGFFGGVGMATVVGTVVAAAFGAYSLVAAFILALLLAVASQIGDLFESWVKRRAKVKQSSDLIPGHGGVLDRIDGLIFAAVFFAVFQTLIGVGINWW